ncbi:MAG: hypothetical protein NC411_09070 [Bacteroides sp.]|nr:hypothetical protein [Bacteroides sp.]
MLAVLDSVEFYVIAAVIAAAVVAFSAKGRDTGPVRQYLLPGVLSLSEESDIPSIELTCCDDGSVILHRRGLVGMALSGAVSLAVNVKGFDVEIKERVVAGKPGDVDVVDTASFILDFMGAERYFISYTAEDAGLFAAITLHNRPGIRVVKQMQ